MSAGWLDDNRRALALEFRRIAAGIRGAEDSRAEDKRAALHASMAAPPAIDVLTDSFGLTTFERDLVLLLAGVELDAALAEQVTALTGGVEVSASLALARLPAPHWSAFTAARPLRRWRIVERDFRRPLASAPLRLAGRIIEYLLGVNTPDQAIVPLLTRLEVGHAVPQAHREIASRLVDAWCAAEGRKPLIHLEGDDAFGADDVASLVCAELGLELFAVAAEELPVHPTARHDVVTLWERDGALLPGMLLVRCQDAPPPATVAFVEAVGAPLIVAAPGGALFRRRTIREAVCRPEALERKRLWLEALGTEGAAMNGALDGVAAQFRFSARTIAATGAVVAGRRDEGAEAALWRACRGEGTSGLGALAERIMPVLGWDDLVLPAPQIAILRHIAGQVRHRTRVVEEWGFGSRSSRGLGTSALFAGGSGTGNTLAAEVLAAELGLALYRIDLSAVVSKYIGETEKNLRRIFDVADDSGAVLLFDEADALFGKRSDVKDSHDRYANIEVSYLLQRMEAYRGLAILTTNLKSALDPSFQRRLRFIVDFPFPDALRREEIWRLAIPANAPTESLDHAKLARLNVSGGAVRNIALNAAYLAAESDEPIGMHHLLAAAHAESAKLERPLGATETRGWV